jgi:hypothetical protein
MASSARDRQPQCPLLAQSRHGLVHRKCLLLTQSGLSQTRSRCYALALLYVVPGAAMRDGNLSALLVALRQRGRSRCVRSRANACDGSVMSHRRHADSAEEMVGDSQADCAERDESGCPAGSYQSCRISYVWRHPDHCTTARRRCEPLTPRMLPKYGGLIVTPHAAASVHRSLVVALAARVRFQQVS